MHIHAYDSSVKQHMEQTFAKFKEKNIVKAVVSPARFNNKDFPAEKWYSKEPETVLIGNGHVLSPDELRQKHAEGKLHLMAEFLPFYDGMLATDERLTPYFDLAEELDIPIGYHMFPGGAPGGAYSSSFNKNIRASNANPMQLEEVLISHPTMRLYVMHGGWPYLEDMKALMYAHPQLYLGIGVINWGLPRPEFHNYLKGLMDAGYGNRIMFGSDQMVMIDKIDLAIDAVNTAEFLTQDQKADIFYNNAARFIRLPEEEIKKHHEIAAHNKR